MRGPVIVFDVLYRLLRHLYGADHVKYVRNITDVDDKINARAAERGIAIRELTEEHLQRISRTTLPRSAACRRMSSRARPSISRR